MRAITALVLLTCVHMGCRSPAGDLYHRRSAAMYQDGRPWYETTSPSPELPGRADLAAYLRYGMHHNAGLRAAFHRWQAAVERIDQMSALPDPVFSYAHFVEDIETRTGPQRQRFGLQQTFPWFGKLQLKGDMATAAAESLWWQVIAARVEVVREIKQAYYEYAYLGQAIRIDEDNLVLLQQLEPVVQRRVQTGGKQDDLLKLQVEIGRLENDLETLRKFRPALSERLRAAMNSRGRGLLPIPDAIEAQFILIDTDDLFERAVAGNQELAGLREDIRGAAAMGELAELAGWPDLTVGADYFETGDARVAGTPGSGDDPIAVRVSMNLPIWRGKYEAQAREAESREAAARSQLHDKQAVLRASIEHSAYELDDAARQVRLYRDTLLPRARQAFELAQSSYRAAETTVLDVIDAERTLLMFEKSYWRAVSKYEQGLADLEAICGGAIR